METLNYLAAGIPEKELDLHPFCNVCGWRKGGLHCWDKNKCKCGHYEPSFRMLFSAVNQASA